MDCTHVLPVSYPAGMAEVEMCWRCPTPMAFVHDKPGKPGRQIVRRVDLVADEQAASDGRAAEAGDDSRLEAVAGDQFAKPGHILFERPAGPLEEGGQTQLCDDLDVAIRHGFDSRLHDAYPKKKPPGEGPAVAKPWFSCRSIRAIVVRGIVVHLDRAGDDVGLGLFDGGLHLVGHQRLVVVVHGVVDAAFLEA